MDSGVFFHIPLSFHPCTALDHETIYTYHKTDTDFPQNDTGNVNNLLVPVAPVHEPVALGANNNNNNNDIVVDDPDPLPPGFEHAIVLEVELEPEI